MKHALLSSVTLASLLLFAAAPAGAEPSRGDQKPAQGDCDRAHASGHKCKSVDFEKGSDVDGSRPSAGGDVIDGRNTLGFSTLIKPREDFRKEIFRTAERL